MGRHCLTGRNETELFKIERRDLDIIVDRFPNVKERLWAVGTAVKVRMQRALQIGDLGNGAGGDWSNDPELPGGDEAEGDTRQRRGETEVRQAGPEELGVVGDGESSEAMSSPRKPAPPPRKSIAELEAGEWSVFLFHLPLIRTGRGFRQRGCTQTKTSTTGSRIPGY